MCYSYTIKWWHFSLLIMHEHAKAKNKRCKQFILHSYSLFQFSFPPPFIFGFNLKAIKYLILHFGVCFLFWVALEMTLIIQWTCDNGLQVGVLVVWFFFHSWNQLSAFQYWKKWEEWRMCSRIQKYWPVWTNTNVVHVKFNGLGLFFVLEMIICQEIIQLSHHWWGIVCTLRERWCLKIKKPKVHIKWAAHLLLACRGSSFFITQYEGFEYEDIENISQRHRALTNTNEYLMLTISYHSKTKSFGGVILILFKSSYPSKPNIME